MSFDITTLTLREYRKMMFYSAISKSDFTASDLALVVQNNWLRPDISFGSTLAGLGQIQNPFESLLAALGQSSMTGIATRSEVLRAIRVLHEFELLIPNSAVFRKVFPDPMIFTYLASKGIESAQDGLKLNGRGSLILSGFPPPFPSDEMELDANVLVWNIASPIYALLVVALYRAKQGQAGLPAHVSSKFTSVLEALFTKMQRFIDYGNESIPKMLAIDKGKPSIAGVTTVYKKKIMTILNQLKCINDVTKTPGMTVFLYSKGYTTLYSISQLDSNKFRDLFTFSKPWQTSSGWIWSQITEIVSRTAFHGIKLIQQRQGSGLHLLDQRKDRVQLDITLAVEGINELTQATHVPLTYENLFGSHMVASCPHGCNTVLSPTAYFVDLMQFLKYCKTDEAERDGDSRFSVLTHLLARRLDLVDLELSCENAMLQIPYIDLANEAMESWIFSRLTPLGVAAPEVTYPQSILNPTLTPKSILSSRLEIRNNNAGLTSEELAANPAYVLHEVYKEKISEQVYPMNIFPYSYAVDTIRTILKAMKSSRLEICRLFYPNPLNTPTTIGSPTQTPRLFDDRTSRIQAAENLGLIEEEFLAITGEGFSPPGTGIARSRPPIYAYWGYETMDSLKSMDFGTGTGLSFVKDQFLARAGINLKDLVLLLSTRYLNAEKKIVLVVTPDHDFRKVVLKYHDGKALTDAVWDKFSRFLRLLKVVGCSVRDLDNAIDTAMRVEEDAMPYLKPSYIIHISKMSEASKLTGFKFSDTLKFWSNLNTDSSKVLTKEAVERFLYDKIVDKSESEETQLEPSSLTSVLRLNSQEFLAIQASGSILGSGFDDRVTAANLSRAYRLVLLSRSLSLPILSSPIFFEKIFLHRYESPFRSPSATLNFITRCKSMLSYGFGWQDLALLSTYQKEIIIRGEYGRFDRSLKDLLPVSEKTGLIRSLSLLSSLWQFRVEINNKFPVLGETTVEDVQRLALNIFNSPTVLEIIAFLQREQAHGGKQFKSTSELEEFYTSTLLDIFARYPDAKKELLSQTASAADRRLKFCEYLTNYLRRRDDEAAMLSVLRSSGLEVVGPEILNVLAMDIQKRGDSSVGTIMHDLTSESLDEATDGDENTKNGAFDGFLQPHATDSYRFVIHQTDVEIFINDEKLAMSDLSATDNKKTTAAVKLTAGNFYRFRTSRDTIEKLEWRGVRSSDTPVSSASFLVTKSLQSHIDEQIFERLHGAAIVAQKLGLGPAEILHIQKDTFRFPDVDFGRMTLAGLETLINYKAMKTISEKIERDFITLFSVVDKQESLETSKLVDLISKSLILPTSYISQFLAMHSTPTMGKETTNLKTLSQIIQQASLLEKLEQWDINLEFLKDLALSERNEYDVARELKNIYDSRTPRERWLASAGEQVYEPLRTNRRKALTNYLLHQPEMKQLKVFNADHLFEYFLIDVQMGPELKTSRIRQAVSTIQLFVQRCQLGLEANTGINPKDIMNERWEWMKKYNLWEANRRIFLYPENWIEPSVRDNKTEIFDEFETKLQQKNLTLDVIHSGLKDYITSLYNIRSLSIQAVYKEFTKTPSNVLENPGIVAIHYFGRTPVAPYMFYYCKWMADGDIWTQWTKIDVEITTHETEATGGSGSAALREPSAFLVPAMWDGRLFLFLPEFRTCVSPVPVPSANKDDPSASGMYNQMQGSQPALYYEIRINWTEYRHGKWTPLHSCSPPAISNGNENEYVGKIPPEAWGKDWSKNVTDRSLPPLTDYTFVTGTVSQCEGGDMNDSRLCLVIKRREKGTVRAFVINGGSLAATDVSLVRRNAANVGVDKDLQFSKDTSDSTKHRICTYQEMSADDSLVYVNKDIADHHFIITKAMLPTNREDDLYNAAAPPLLNSSKSTDFMAIFKTFNQQWGHITSETYGNLRGTLNWHEMRTLYSLYNWEIGVHTPMLLMDRLLKTQQFDLALQVGRAVFDPFEANGPEGLSSCWQWPAFLNLSAEEAMQSALGKYNPSAEDTAFLNQAVAEWRNKPFQPYLIARGRPLAYMKWILVKYLETLVAYGDYYFRQNSFDTIPLAIQLYVQAAHLYGNPEVEPVRMAGMQVQSYHTLSTMDGGLDKFSDAVVQMEYKLPFVGSAAGGGAGSGGNAAIIGAATASSIVSMAATRYFSVPLNPKIREIGNVIHDRLDKIRASLDINGIPIRIPLFDAPVEPGLLIQAVAAGGIGGLASVSDSLSSPMPNYRFNFAYQRALSLCQELMSSGSRYLEIREKRDAESMTLLQTQQQSAIFAMALKIKQLAVDDSKKELKSLEQSRKGVESRMGYYLKLIGEPTSSIPNSKSEFKEIAQEIDEPTKGALRMSPEETAEFALTAAADRFNDAANVNNILATACKMLPEIAVEVEPLGVGAGTYYDAAKLGTMFELGAQIKQLLAGIASSSAGQLARVSSLKNQLRERRLLANEAGYELKTIDAQIDTQRVKIEMAEKDLEMQAKQIEQSHQVEEYLRSKFTNEALYLWMDNAFQQFYYQSYTLAYDLAKASEKTYHYERGEETVNYIKFGYWNAGKQGIGCAENLYLDLKKLELAYVEKRAHDYELAKDISLKRLNPVELLRLMETGSAEIDIPEVLFDLDFPGHYTRRIKSVSITIDCATEPHTTINCVLRLLQHRYRADSKGDTYLEDANGDPRFKSMQVPIQSIATSTAQSDSGVFEIEFNNDRYIPFEGAGVISKWSIELPEQYRQFDYFAISDVVFHLKYTSKDGGETLKERAIESIGKILKGANANKSQLCIDVSTEFAIEWSRFTTSETKPPSIELKGLGKSLPYLASYVGVKLLKIHLYTTNEAADLVVEMAELKVGQTTSNKLALKYIGSEEGLQHYASEGDNVNFGVTIWTMDVKGELKEDDKCWLIVDYSLGGK